MTNNNGEERKVTRTRRTRVIKEPVVPVEETNTDTHEDSLIGTVLTEQEAIREAKEAGISPEVTKAVLENRKYIVAGAAALGVVIVFALGIVAGLGFANTLAAEVSDSSNTSLSDMNTTEPAVPGGVDFVKPDNGDYSKFQAWLDGYKSGFSDGYQLNNGDGRYYLNGDTSSGDIRFDDFSNDDTKSEDTAIPPKATPSE